MKILIYRFPVMVGYSYTTPVTVWAVRYSYMPMF